MTISLHTPAGVAARPQAPHDYPRRILLATVGLNPQVVTETLYALATADIPFVPTEIHLVTTTEGAAKIRGSLLGENGEMGRLAADLDRPALAHALAPDRVHVIGSATGEPLDDISSAADHAATADTITALVRELAADPDAALHGSIAGGRKSMGFLLGYAFTLFGRMQDRMSHVLINAPFETHPEFYFPPKVPRTLALRDGTQVSTAEADVKLADISFVRLRDGLPTPLLDGAASYTETVTRAQELVQPARLVVDSASERISCGGVAVKLTPSCFVFYKWLAVRRCRLGDAAGINAKIAISDLDNVPPEIRSKLDAGLLDEDFISQRKTRTNDLLTEQLGRADTVYHIGDIGRLSGGRAKLHGLSLPPAAITFGPVPASLTAADIDED